MNILTWPSIGVRQTALVCKRICTTMPAGMRYNVAWSVHADFTASLPFNSSNFFVNDHISVIADLNNFLSPFNVFTGKRKVPVVQGIFFRLSMISKTLQNKAEKSAIIQHTIAMIEILHTAKQTTQTVLTILLEYSFSL